MIQKINNYENQPSFQAKLNISGMPLGEARAARVGKYFEKMTQHYSGDTFSIQKNINPYANCLDFETNGNIVNKTNFEQFADFYVKKPAKEVAKYIARVFKKDKLDESTLHKLAINHQKAFNESSHYMPTQATLDNLYKSDDKLIAANNLLTGKLFSDTDGPTLDHLYIYKH